MYTLKSIVRRGTPLAAVFAIVAATVAPSTAVFADALNPLTERSLLLSSSAPGYVDTDGSGNSAGSTNSIGENYAPAGSGPNGKKTGETFSFKVSSTATIKAFDLQYCTGAAGNCQAPGDNTGDQRTSNRLANATPTTGGWALKKSDLEVSDQFTQGEGAGEFQIYINDVAVETEDWTMTAVNKEDTAHLGALTGKKNYVTLKSETGEEIESGNKVTIVFRPSETVFITNPGSGAFFVKMNTYNSDTTFNDTTKVDGGVTVANVMTDSIHITTKVLETMAFSVGTRNRDTLTLNCGEDYGTPQQPEGCESDENATHRSCDPMQNVNGNRLDLGNPDAEYSLETGRAWDVHSYWRLSSNSSGGAAVYYSGDTLRNTVGDSIKDVQSETLSTPGTEQFGLGFVNAGDDTLSSEFTTQYPGVTPSSKPFKTLDAQEDETNDFPGVQTASAAYDEAAGTITGTDGAPGTAKFKFLASSLTEPELIAQENTEVIRCATAKMRYVGNIAADTPAGVYTTKINYLAAPQY